MLPFKIVWLSGMPRSGTNWLSQIFESNERVNFKLAPLFSYAFRNTIGENASKSEWEIFFDGVFNSDDSFLNQTQKRAAGIFPTFEKDEIKPDFLVIKETRYHYLMPKLLSIFPEIKIIYIVRNPCGAINSWLSSPKEFPENANPMEEWRTGNCRKTREGEFWGFNDWKLLTNQYLGFEEQFPNNVKVISYEDLVEHPSEITNDMFQFVGLDFSVKTREFIELSQSTNSEHWNAVYKTKEVKDKWKNYLHSEIVEAIRQELSGTNLEGYFYK